MVDRSGGRRPPRREAPDPVRLREPRPPAARRVPGSRTSRYARSDVERLAATRGRARRGAGRRSSSTRPSPPSTPPATCRTGAGTPPAPRSTRVLRGGRGVALGHDLRALRPLVRRSRRPRGRAVRSRPRSPPRPRCPTGSAWWSPRCGPATRSATTGVCRRSCAGRHVARDPRRGAPAGRRARRAEHDRVTRGPALDPCSPLEPTTRRVRVLDRALSLLADHELATSTFAVRVAASAWADPYLLLLTGLATSAARCTAAHRSSCACCSATRSPPTPSTPWAARCATTSACPGSDTPSTTARIHVPRCSSTRWSGAGHPPSCGGRRRVCSR